MVITSLGVTTVLMVLSQGRRTVSATESWAKEEEGATSILMTRLEEWLRQKTEYSRKGLMTQQGHDPLLGDWEWSAQLDSQLQAQVMGGYRIRLHWNGPTGPREVETYVVSKLIP